MAQDKELEAYFKVFFIGDEGVGKVCLPSRTSCRKLPFLVVKDTELDTDRTCAQYHHRDFRIEA